jgi:hypothetical protein
MYLVFDIETVPDVAALGRWLRLPAEADADTVMAAFSEARPDAVMPKPLFHQIVAIAGAVIGDDGRLQTLRAMGDPDDSEAALIERFFAYLERAHPRLVGWNSSGFDLPCLQYRALRHRLAIGAFYRQRGYRYRYNEEFHWDLMDLLSAYGASTRVALDEMAALCGIPGKLEVDGRDVWPLYRAGQLDRIRRYCETDVLSTSIIFVRYALLRGLFDTGRAAAFDDSVTTLLRETEEEHLKAYREAWSALDEGPS